MSGDGEKTTESARTGTSDRRTHQVARVGVERAHCDKIALPEEHYVLVDESTWPSDTVTFTETIPVYAPSPPAHNVTSRKLDAGGPDYHGSDGGTVQDEKRVHYLVFWQTVDGATMTLELARGPKGDSKLVILDGISGKDLCEDDAPAKATTVAASRVLVHAAPKRQPTTHNDLKGSVLDYSRISVKEPTVDEP